MNRYSVLRIVSMIGFIGCIALLLVSCAHKTQATASGGNVVVAQEMVDSMAKGDFVSASKAFDTRMKAAMPVDKFGEAWTQLTAQAGAFKSRIGSREAQQAGFQVVLVACQFEKTQLDIKVVFNQDGTIGGLWFVPHSAVSKAEYAVPAYVQTDRFHEKPVVVGEGEWKLPGTLTLPNGSDPFPAVVLVHGSGPQDRDESIGPNKPFKDIAWGLASRGIAVLRYDKRTKVYGQKIAAMDNLTPKEEVTDDVLAAVEVLRKSENISPDKIYVIGHSLGGFLIPRIGKMDTKLAGLVVVAGCTRPLEDVMLDQLTYITSLNGPMNDDAKKEIGKYKDQIASVKSLTPSAKSSASSLLLGAPASYWLDIRGYVPAEEAKSLKQPMLILQGGRDYQVTEKDFDIWKDALSTRANVTLKLYPDLNHLFMEGTGKATPSEYEKAGSVSKTLITDIAEWIIGQQKVKM